MLFRSKLFVKSLAIAYGTWTGQDEREIEITVLHDETEMSDGKDLRYK